MEKYDEGMLSKVMEKEEFMCVENGVTHLAIVNSYCLINAFVYALM